MLRNKNGFSTIEILIAVGIISGLALVAINISDLNIRSSSKFTFDSDTQNIYKELGIELSNPAKCFAALGGQDASANSTPITGINGKYLIDSAGAPTNGYGNSNIHIESYQLQASPSDLAQNISYLFVTFIKKQSLKNSSAANINTKKIKLNVAVDASNLITECSSIATLGNTIWQRATGTNIHYDSGFVGMGTNNPTIPLNVNGILNVTSGKFDINFIDWTGSTSNSINIGIGNNISYKNSTAIGRNNYAGQGDGHVTIGISNTANAGSADAITSIGVGNNAISGTIHLGSNNNSNFTGANGTVNLGIGLINQVGNSMQFGPSNTAKAIILSNGNFGIGLTNPAEKLEINGTLKMSDFQLTSDRQLKENIKSLNKEEITKALLNLGPVKFQWLKNKIPDQGFIAQEVKKIFPKLVILSKNHRGLGIRYIPLIAMTVNAIQEIHDRQEQLKIKIRNNEMNIKELRKQINSF